MFNGLISLIANLLGYVIRFIYNICNKNYFIAIILFTILTKLILFPLFYKQLKSTEETKKIQPEIEKIKNKYKKDQQKQAEALTKLYSDHKINPVGGCLPLLIQIPLIIAMFYIVKYPVTYVLKVPQEQVVEYAKQYLVDANGINLDEITYDKAKAYEIDIAAKCNLIDMKVGKYLDLGDTPANVFSSDETKRNETSKVSLIIPVLSFVLAFVSNKITQKNASMTEEQEQMQRSMNIMMPLLSASISYSMPLALGIYWLFGSLLSILQQFVMQKILTEKDKEKNDEVLLLK